MKNKEKYNLKECDITFENGTVKLKKQWSCILFKNYKAFIEWLEEEHSEPIKINRIEKWVLENINKIFRWIVRDKNGELYLHSAKPTKIREKWETMDGGLWFPCQEFFKFIKWENDKPYNIQELLDNCEVTNR